MAYIVRIVRSAEKDFRKLPKEIQIRIRKKMIQLSEEPKFIGSIQLRDSTSFRVRVGAYRIIYEITEELKTVTILAIGHRKDVYR